jgi:hypothetical protein
MSKRPSRELWQPMRLVRVVESYDTSTGTTKVKTDATFGYLKALGNRQGPHTLASEFVASSLAVWFGLTVPPFAIFDLDPEACFELPRGVRTQPGPAFISQHIAGRTWGGSETELRTVENRTDITRLVVFDTWLRNCDRHPADLKTRKPNYANVFLENTRRSSRTRLVAIDHTHCFDCGRDFSERLGDIDKVKDERTYGLFPAFSRFIDRGELLWCTAMLRSFDVQALVQLVNRLPAAWQVSSAAREALVLQVRGRASFLADRIESGWIPGAPGMPD